jgi:hypothetical protein
MTYNEDIDLGDKVFYLDGQPFMRTDYEVFNKKGQVLKCSHYEP